MQMRRPVQELGRGQGAIIVANVTMEHMGAKDPATGFSPVTSESSEVGFSGLTITPSGPKWPGYKLEERADALRIVVNSVSQSSHPLTDLSIFPEQVD
jgi:hypothetical protein